MKGESFDKTMMEYEVNANLKVPMGNYICLRLDGRKFHTEVKRLGLERPFDKKLREALVTTTKYLIKEFPDIIFAYTESDEVTLILARDSLLFNRRPEKLCSVIPSYFSVVFNKVINTGTEPDLNPCFDCRILVFPTFELVKKNIKWRIYDSARNSISTYLLWTKVSKESKSTRKVTKEMDRMKDFEKKKVLENFDINWADIPAWICLGTFIYKVKKMKIGYNPIKKVAVETERYELNTMDVSHKDFNIDAIIKE